MQYLLQMIERTRRYFSRKNAGFPVKHMTEQEALKILETIDESYHLDQSPEWRPCNTAYHLDQSPEWRTDKDRTKTIEGILEIEKLTIRDKLHFLEETTSSTQGVIEEIGPARQDSILWAVISLKTERGLGTIFFPKQLSTQEVDIFRGQRVNYKSSEKVYREFSPSNYMTSSQHSIEIIGNVALDGKKLVVTF